MFIKAAPRISYWCEFDVELAAYHITYSNMRAYAERLWRVADAGINIVWC
jgi:hypothetical protein